MGDPLSQCIRVECLSEYIIQEINIIRCYNMFTFYYIIFINNYIFIKKKTSKVKKHDIFLFLLYLVTSTDFKVFKIQIQF